MGHDTDASENPLRVGVGLGTIDQVLPSYASTRVDCGPLELKEDPTANHERTLAHDTPES